MTEQHGGEKIDNPGLETSDDPGVWPEWMACASDGFATDEGVMFASFKVVPEGDWPDMVGAVPIYKDGYTFIGMAWLSEGKATYYVNSKRRPWWAVGILSRFWCWRQRRWRDLT